uniref:Sodium/chloride dependent transporter n=1 Tax=Meloidogyne hapla TaxID=6305 RepID=A0A1I8B3M2_MELHA
MEVTVGQYLQRGAMEMWKMCPIFKGETCNNYWNNGQCVTGKESTVEIMRITSNLSRYGLSIESSVEQFWERRVLKQTATISDIGGIQWELLGLMFLSWVIVYFALWKGITQARNDAIVMCFINGMTSILAGFAIFSILGYMSYVASKPIADIVKPGVGLAFLAYPEVASNLPLKQLWAFLFFLMITILGLDSQISLLVTCVFFFIIGIPMVTYAGAHWLTLVDAYGASGIALLFVVFFEVVGLAWGFGENILLKTKYLNVLLGTYRVRKALKEMVGFYPLSCFNILWKYTAPLSALILFVCCLVMYEPLRYPTGKNYPYWAEAFGFCLSACSMVVIPVYALYYIFHRGDNLTSLERFRRGIHPPSELETTARRGHPDEELEFIDKPRTPKGVSSAGV